jgi:phage protein U
MLLAIGLFAFEIPTLAHDELQRRASWDHAKAQRIGARPATQYVGPGEETLSLSGTAWAELQNGRASLDQLREMAGQGAAWPVIDGAGYVFGNFVITAIDERHKHFFADGRARNIDFGIDLMRVDDTPTAG